jgi:Zn-dependent protease with chaperone function
VTAWHLGVRARRHPVAFAVTGGVIAAQAAYAVTMAGCQPMTLTQCLLAANAVVLGVSVTAITARAACVGAATARAVAALPQASCPGALASAARRAGIRRVRYLAGSGCAAFCAGLAWPAVYLTAAAATLTPGQLDAVLSHEAAHARRRDPLRRLIARAAADTLFYLPLARWWARRQAESAELRADQAAVGYAGREAVASALLATGDERAPAAAAAAYGGVTAIRVAQLLGDKVPARRPSPAVVILTVLGLIAAVWLAMCLGQTLLSPVAPL